MQHDTHVNALPTKQLAPYARNARTHTIKQIRQVARSIKAFGFINPIIIDENNTIIAGHARVLAAQEIGMDDVPTICVDHLSEAEKRAYILADNKIAENAGWDENLLRVELEYLTQINIDVDVDLTGFEMAEIDILLGGLDENTPEDSPPSLPDPEETVTQINDVWLLGQHRLICGDCRDPDTVNQLMVDSLARMVISDPPLQCPY